MAFVTGSYNIRSLAPECKFCNNGFQAAEAPKRTLCQIVCCQDPEIEIEVVAHRVGNIYHAFHPACYQLYVQNPNPKCLHCDAKILSLDAQPLVPPPVKDPDEALIRAAGDGDLEIVRKLLGGKHRFQPETINQASRIAASFDHTEVVTELETASSRPSRRASLAYERKTDRNFAPQTSQDA